MRCEERLAGFVPFEVCGAWRGCLAAHDDCAMIVNNSSSMSLYGGRKKEMRSGILGGHYYIKGSRVSFCGLRAAYKDPEAA